MRICDNCGQTLNIEFVEVKVDKPKAEECFVAKFDLCQICMNNFNSETILANIKESVDNQENILNYA